jgi:hypothetical protein
MACPEPTRPYSYLHVGSKNGLLDQASSIAVATSSSCPSFISNLDRPFLVAVFFQMLDWNVLIAYQELQGGPSESTIVIWSTSTSVISPVKTWGRLAQDLAQ